MGEAELKVSPGIRHLRILISDDPAENIRCFFESASSFIASELPKTHVLVHCKAGVSRSASIVAAFLIRYRSMTLEKALEHLR
jgi:protein-tyrosine phosphatase